MSFNFTDRLEQQPSTGQNLSKLTPVAVAVLLIFCISARLIHIAFKRSIHLAPRDKNTEDSHLRSLFEPPLVRIPHDVQISDKGLEEYNRILDEHDGGVVIIPRHGRKEYVIDHKHAFEVLTDAKHFTFDKGVVNMLHMEFMLWFKDGSFVNELDTTIQNGVQPRISAVVERVAPALQEAFDDLLNSVGCEDEGQAEIDDLFPRIQRAVAHAMVVLILGPDHITPILIDHFVAITIAVSHLSGIYENTEGWPWAPYLYSITTTARAIIFTIIPRFFCAILPSLWKSRYARLEHGVEAKTASYVPLFDLLLAKHLKPATGLSSIGNFFWCSVVSLGLIFASVHQTAVVATWVVYQLAARQDTYLAQIRSEWNQHIKVDSNGRPLINATALSQLSLLDSFIREVMRTKGDTFAPVRFTSRPVQIGKYRIPVNALCAPLVQRVHSHPDNYGASGKTFDGFQWHAKQRPATQNNENFISFGLGRWACPGRFLALHEIKMVVYSLFERVDVRIKDGTYRVVDPMNATSRAPEAVLVLRRR